MAPMNLTREQQLAVTSKGLVMVSASAGSGKTHTMLERIMHLIESGVGLDRMLILVYNEANASELREKIRQKLFEKVCETVGDTADMYRKQLDEIAFSTICTIHAFCRTAIRKNFEVIGINPDFDILDENTHKVYMSKAMDKVFAEYVEKADGVFLDMLSVFESKRSEDNIRDYIVKLFESMDVQYDLDKFVESIRSYYESPQKFDDIIIGRIHSTMKKICAVAEETLPQLIVDGQDTYIGRIQDIIALLPYLESRDTVNLIRLYDDMCGETIKAKSVKGGDKKNTARAKLCMDTAKEHLAIIKALYQDIEYKNIVFEQNKTFATKFLELTLRFKEILEDMKTKDNVMAFGDLEHGAVKLIKEGVDIGADYDYVFVDEYQDVNGAQEYVISNLVKDEAFMVGDVKQSIYGFRLSDPEIFLARQRKYEDDNKNGKGNAPIFFNENFRSDNQILQFVNGVFDYAMTKENTGVDYKTEGKFKDVADVQRCEGRVEIHVFQNEESAKRISEKLYKLNEHDDVETMKSAEDHEGEYIASEIEKLMRTKRLTIKGVERPLQYGDFALLFRKRNKDANTIINVLKKRGIPVDDGSFAKEEVPVETEFINMLSVIDNPRQDYALAGFMLSYLGGYTESELYAIVQNSHEGILYDKVVKYSKLDDALAQKIRSTLDNLNKYRVKGSYMSVKNLVEEMVTDTCYDAYLASKSKALANSFDAYIKGISEDDIILSKYLREYKESDRKAKGRPEGGDKVQVSTFHSYKGLETPVVFLPNAGDVGGKGGGNAKDLSVDANGCIAMSYFDMQERKKDGNTLSNKAVQMLIQEKEYKEEMRLLYVALTRAQKIMYITGTCGVGQKVEFGQDSVQAKFVVENFEREKSIFNYIFTAKDRGTLDFTPILHVRSGQIARPEDEKPFFEMGGKRTQYDDELAREIEKVKTFEYPYDEETRLSMKYTVTQINNEGAKDITVTFPTYEDDGEDNGGVSVAEIGTAYHKVMEYIDFAIDNVEDVKSAIDQMVADGVLTREARDLVEDDKILTALMDPIIKESAGARCRHEQPFMIYVPAKEVLEGSNSTDKVLVQGVIDLLVEGKKKYIVDFKYSSLKGEESKNKYKKQLYLYKMAYELSFGEKIDKVVLLSLKTGESFEL